MAALLSSTLLCHTIAAPSSTINNSMLAVSTVNKNGLLISKKPSSSSSSPSSPSVRCLLHVKAPASAAAEDAVSNLSGVTLDVTLRGLLKPDFHKSDFPPDFLFGASTSALQTEGQWNEGGRGRGIWDDTLEGKDAIRSYHLYDEDVKVLKEMGMKAYRFSIAWPRILPNGTLDGGINQEGVHFYNTLIDKLLANGIEPIVTLLHFDLPQALQDKYKGFLHPQFVEHFKEYADFCFRTFGDRVKIWGTINEPLIFVYLGQQMGFPPELQTDPLAPYIAYHHILLAHAAAAKHYQQHYKRSQHGKIGISLPIQWSMPYDPNDPLDLAAAEVTRDIQIGWFMNPLVHGDYPEWLKKNIKGLPEFSEEEKKMVKGAYDYIGINYYTSRYFQQSYKFESLGSKISVTYEAHTNDVNGNNLGVQAKGRNDIYDYPEGLKQLLVYIKCHYGNPELYITENGTSTLPDVKDSIENLKAQKRWKEVEDALCDDSRMIYAMGHLKAVLDAQREGVNVKGYIAWSLVDNMEMGSEKPYDVRFGLNFVDYRDNYKRIPKKSARWFYKFLSGSFQ